MPTNTIYKNIKNGLKKETILYLTKKNHELPYGEFDMQVLFKPIHDEDYYKTTGPMYFDLTSPTIININKCVDTDDEDEDDEVTSSESSRDDDEVDVVETVIESMPEDQENDEQDSGHVSYDNIYTANELTKEQDIHVVSNGSGIEEDDARIDIHEKLGFVTLPNEIVQENDDSDDKIEI